VDACPYLGGCKLYPLFKLRASLRTWQVRYCEAEYTACQRYKTAKRGEPVPLQLLPNGTQLPTTPKRDP
jgi:hypothetical protein